MRKCLIPLLAALLTLVGCNSNKVSYKGFSFEFPENYKLTKNVSVDGMRCMLEEAESSDLFLVEVVPDFKKEWGLEEAGNEEIGNYLANAVYDMYNQFLYSDEDVRLDQEFRIDSSADDDYAPYAYAEVSGKLGDAPFRAMLNSDIWGENQVTTLIIAYSNEKYDEMFKGIFGSYQWKE
ncbi:MAG: hypothetical protein J5519_07130 [Bacteroidales bacterium]|nr:hypothetical protein [Bacteroidales bacterium]